MTSRFPPFAFVELVSPYNKKNITRWRKDMNFMFLWQEQYLTRSLRSLVRYCSCHSNIKFISFRHRVISSIYLLDDVIFITEGSSKTKEKIPEDVEDTEVKQNVSQVNTRLSTNVKELPLTVRSRVCSLLNVKRDRDFDDFRMLAEKVGLGKDKIDIVEQKEDSPTHAILTEWSIRNSEATVGKLIEMLKEEDFRRMDVVKILEDWVNESN